jgi:two-component system, OmpR family, response regulator CpxR
LKPVHPEVVKTHFCPPAKNRLQPTVSIHSQAASAGLLTVLYTKSLQIAPSRMKPCSRKATAGNERPSGWEIELMIVVADDDPLVQHSCKHLLEAAGYKVALATTGLEAIRALERSNVSAVLVDVFMPEMDGIETLLSIKKQSPTTSVIVMTGGGARGRMDFLEAATRLGADEVVQKPFTAEQLVAAVKRCSHEEIWRI